MGNESNRYRLHRVAGVGGWRLVKAVFDEEARPLLGLCPRSCVPPPLPPEVARATFDATVVGGHATFV